MCSHGVGCVPPLLGLVPTHSRFSSAPSPPPGAAPEPPLRGTHSPSFTRTPAHILCLGSPRRLVPLRRIQSPVSRAAFLGHTQCLLAHSPSDHKSPLRPHAPWLCLGAHPALGWPFPLRAPTGSAGAPTAQGRLSAVLGRPHAVRWGLPHSTAASTRLPPPPLWMGPGGFRAPLCAGSHLLPALPVGESPSYSVPAAQRGRLFTHPSLEHRVLLGRLLQGYGAHLGRYPQGSAPRNRVQGPHCRALPVHLLVRSDSEPLRAGPELTNSCSWTGQ